MSGRYWHRQLGISGMQNNAEPRRLGSRNLWEDSKGSTGSAGEHLVAAVAFLFGLCCTCQSEPIAIALECEEHRLP